MVVGFQTRVVPLLAAAHFWVHTNQMYMEATCGENSTNASAPRGGEEKQEGHAMFWKAVQQCRMSQFLFGKSSNGATQADLPDVGWYDDEQCGHMFFKRECLTPHKERAWGRSEKST